MSEEATFAARCGCGRTCFALPLEVSPSAAIAATYEQKTMWRQPQGRGLTATGRNAFVSAADCVDVARLLHYCWLGHVDLKDTSAMCLTVCAEA